MLYRDDKVFIRGATYVPPSQDALRDMTLASNPQL